MALSLIEALAKLDPKNDNHWTVEGQPRLDTVKFFAGQPSLMREELDKVCVYTREDALAGKAPELVSPASTTPEAAASPPVVAATATSTAPVAPEPPAAPVAVEPPKPFDMEEAQANLSALNDGLAAVNQQLYQLNKVRDGINEQISTLEDLVRKHSPADTTSHAVQQYHARQKQLLEQRATQIDRVRSFEQESGVKLSDLVPKKAPIDQARKNSRGGPRSR